MAEVFRGIAESSVGGLKRNVAIKRILPNLTKNKKFVQMFLDEAKLAMYLQHANIVQVYDIGSSATDAGDQAYFLVMEFVDGCNLKVVNESLKAQGQRLPVSQTLYIIMEVCRALAYAHDQPDPDTGKPLGIVHRDISPPNILISKKGEVKLADFGLAKAASQLETTDPGVVKGKFSYLSPEAARAEDVDRRADIFATGILLYEMLTGKRLFDGETDYKTVLMVRQANIPELGPQNPDVTPELEGIVRKALAKDPNERYQRADDLGDAIAQYLFSRGLKVTARDIEQLIVRCVAERQKSSPKGRASLIDNLINDEILKFTSLEEVSAEDKKDGPTSSGDAPLNPDAFVDTRNWGNESETSLPPSSGGPRPSLGVSIVSGKRSSSGNVAPLESLLEGSVKPEAAPAKSGMPLVAIIALLLAIGALAGYFLFGRH
jgi:serine/threonine-protein kinase